MIFFLLRCWQCGVLVLVGVSAALAQPRAEQVDPSALAAAAARLGRVIWSPVATVDRIGVDPFVLRSRGGCLVAVDQPGELLGRTFPARSAVR